MEGQKSHDKFQEFVSMLVNVTNNDEAVIKLIEKRYKKASQEYLASENFISSLSEATSKIQCDPSNKYTHVLEVATCLKRGLVSESKSNVLPVKRKACKQLELPSIKRLKEQNHDSLQSESDSDSERILAKKAANNTANVGSSNNLIDKHDKDHSSDVHTSLTGCLSINTDKQEINKSEEIQKTKEADSSKEAIPDILSYVNLVKKNENNKIDTCSSKSTTGKKRRKIATVVIKERPDTTKSSVKVATSSSSLQLASSSNHVEEPSTAEKSGSEEDKEETVTRPSLTPSNARHVDKLERLLQKLSNEIKKLEEKELSLDELNEEDSTYLLLERYKQKASKVWTKLCELTDSDPIVTGDIHRKFRFQGTRYQEINKKVEKFVNKFKVFPDFQDIRDIILVANRKHHLQLGKRVIEHLARDTFVQVGHSLQELRMKDFRKNFGSHLTDKSRSDPASHNVELQRRLDANKKLGKAKMEEVLEKFSMKQEDGNTGTSSDELEEKEDGDENDNDTKRETKPKTKAKHVEELEEINIVDSSEEVVKKPKLEVMPDLTDLPIILSEEDDEDLGDVEEDAEMDVIQWVENDSEADELRSAGSSTASSTASSAASSRCSSACSEPIVGESVDKTGIGHRVDNLFDVKLLEASNSNIKHSEGDVNKRSSISTIYSTNVTFKTDRSTPSSSTNTSTGCEVRNKCLKLPLSTPALISSKKHVFSDDKRSLKLPLLSPIRMPRQSDCISHSDLLIDKCHMKLPLSIYSNKSETVNTIDMPSSPVIISDESPVKSTTLLNRKEKMATSEKGPAMDYGLTLITKIKDHHQEDVCEVENSHKSFQISDFVSKPVDVIDNQTVKSTMDNIISLVDDSEPNTEDEVNKNSEPFRISPEMMTISDKLVQTNGMTHSVNNQDCSDKNKNAESTVNMLTSICKETIKEAKEQEITSLSLGSVNCIGKSEHIDIKETIVESVCDEGNTEKTTLHEKDRLKLKSSVGKCKYTMQPSSTKDNRIGVIRPRSVSPKPILSFNIESPSRRCVTPDQFKSKKSLTSSPSITSSQSDTDDIAVSDQLSLKITSYRSLSANVVHYNDDENSKLIEPENQTSSVSKPMQSDIIILSDSD